MRPRSSPAYLWIGIPVLYLCSTVMLGQINITTFHNDNARTGQNTIETVLKPSNVNSSQFGKLFTVPVDGNVYAQPLYLSNVPIAGGTHNVVYVATEHNSLYAIDADNGTVYWRVNLTPTGGTTVNPGTDLGCGDLIPEIGITGTPAIDPNSRTIYVVTKTKETGLFVQRLHAIDEVTHVEKFGGPVTISGSVSSSGGTITFNPLLEHQRPALLLQNNHVIIAWGAHCDITPVQGWLMSYNASTLAKEATFNTAPNGSLAGIWGGGSGPAADASGNIYFATGNGTYDSAAKNYGSSLVKLGPPSGGSFPFGDWFTPFNQLSLGGPGNDEDVGSGGVMLLPDLPAGSPHQHLLVQMGKEGKIYLVDRDNMGKFCSSCTTQDTQIVQEIPGATLGIWGAPAYWNGKVYWSSGQDDGGADPIRAFSFNTNSSGLLSTSAITSSAKLFGYSTPSPVVSSNAATNGILWVLDNSAFNSTCCQVLYAYDANNLGTLLYNSNQAANSRDVPGGAVKMTSPIVANGKVYTAGQSSMSAYGIISATPTASTPTFNPAPGSYPATVSVTISDTTPGAVIHCTTNGTIPTGNSPVCTSVSISATTTLQAIAVANGFANSAVASGTYTIGTGVGVNYGGGFTNTGLTLNGSATIAAARLRLTDGGSFEKASAFFGIPQNVQSFANDFSFQLTSPNADGIAFVIQNIGTTALGLNGGGLGYGSNIPSDPPGIGKSIAVKFDLFNNAGEGTNSTGLYTNGASPTFPAVTLGGGVNLHNGNIFNVHMTYDGTTLTMTIKDATVPSNTTTVSWAVNIPSIVGGNTAYVGFTGATGGATAIQEVITWTFANPTVNTPTFSPPPGTFGSSQSVTLSDTTPGATLYYTTNGSTPTTSSTVYSGPITVNTTTTIKAIAAANGFANSAVATGTYTIGSGVGINYGSGFTATGLTLNGSSQINGTRLRLTDGGAFETASAFYNTVQNVQSFTNDFSFQLTNPGADGIAFVIQNSGVVALGGGGGGLGYGSAIPSDPPGIGKSIAVKFDLFNNAGEGTNSTGLYINGASPTIPANTLVGGVDLHSGHVFNVHMTYNGSTLTMTIVDAGVPANTFTVNWTVNIPSIVVGNTAYIGFTASTGGVTATQDVVNWTFSTGSGSSGFSGMTFNGSTKLAGTRLRLTDGGAFETASAFYNTVQNVQSFTNDFSFQLTNPGADGIAFVIQNSGVVALGGGGGGLGYGSAIPSDPPGIGKSIAVKFDLFNNAGEGTNSTGLYTNGASPTFPATTLNGGIDLHSGHVFNVHMTYNGSTLTMTIVDAGVPANTFTVSWTVNIPSIVVGNTAYIGFTAATGGATAIQEIITWNYTQ